VACRSAAPSGSDYATSSRSPGSDTTVCPHKSWLGHGGLSAQIIADDKRWTLLRRCLPDETMDLRVRAAGTLVLRYGQPTTHTVELTRDHLITGEAGGLPASENPAELWQV
jgi:hypothetical protein